MDDTDQAVAIMWLQDKRRRLQTVSIIAVGTLPDEAARKLNREHSC
jgi:hypothetical protein